MDAGNVKWVRLGDYIEQCDERNHSNKYGIEAIKGISTSKTFIDTKANLDGVPLQSYKLVAPRYFAYVPDTWKSHATLTLLATQDLPTFGYNMIDPLKSWCWGSILFYPFKISRFS